MDPEVPSQFRLSALGELDIESLLELLAHNPPWWVYLLVALIPLSICFVTREILCWFWKVNRLNATLERIERLLAEQNARTQPEKTGPTSRNDPLDVTLP